MNVSLSDGANNSVQYQNSLPERITSIYPHLTAAVLGYAAEVKNLTGPEWMPRGDLSATRRHRWGRGDLSPTHNQKSYLKHLARANGVTLPYEPVTRDGASRMISQLIAQGGRK